MKLSLQVKLSAVSCPALHLLLLPQSVYGIARTLFLVCLLGLGSYLIHSDTYR